MRERMGAVLATVVVLVLLVMPAAALASQSDGKPVPSPQDITVSPGDRFELEVPVQAWADGNYTVTFLERTRFSFPGERFQTYSMESGDAILFKVPCQVEDGTPDGEYQMAFEVKWNASGVDQKIFDEITIVVGEGTGDVSICNTMVMVAAPAVLAFSLLIVQRRRYA